MPVAIEICGECDEFDPQADRLSRAAALILQDAGISRGSLSVAIVDDPAIQQFNKRFLQHDYPTDVLSFALEKDERSLEGEVIVSSETAARVAQEIGWQAADELLLYLIHGTLHLIGHDDADDQQRAAMRERERHYLQAMNVTPPDPPA